MRLKTNQQTILTVTPYNVATQLYTVYQNKTTGEWNAETALQAIAHSSLYFIPNNAQGCAEALNYLNFKLEAVRKTISFWDAYQISDAIEDNELLLNKITQLPNNSSLVNNTKDPFIWSNPSLKIDNQTGKTAIEQTEEKVYQGDIFVKDYQGNVHLIHATNKGVYVPSDLVLSGAGNSLSILYKYMSSGSEPATVSIPPRNSELTIGENKHWYINGQDTNLDAETNPVTLGENGNWYINNVDTNIPAQSVPSSSLELEEDAGYNLRGSLDPTESFTFPVLFGPTGESGTTQGGDMVSFDQIAIIPIVKYFDDTDLVILPVAFSGPYNSNNQYVNPSTIHEPTNDLHWKIENITSTYLHYEVR